MTDLPDRPADVAKNPELLNALLARWRPYLIVVARRRMGGRELRMWGTSHTEDDLVQEALLRAARGLHRYDPARGPFRTFLCLQLHAACLELFRLAARQGRSRRPAVAFERAAGLAGRADSRAPDPVATAEENDLWEHVGRNLDAAERALLRLRYREGREWGQVAPALDISRNACDHRRRKLAVKLASADCAF